MKRWQQDSDGTTRTISKSNWRDGKFREYGWSVDEYIDLFSTCNEEFLWFAAPPDTEWKVYRTFQFTLHYGDDDAPWTRHVLTEHKELADDPPCWIISADNYDQHNGFVHIDCEEIYQCQGMSDMILTIGECVLELQDRMLGFDVYTDIVGMFGHRTCIF